MKHLFTLQLIFVFQLAVSQKHSINISKYCSFAPQKTDHPCESVIGIDYDEMPETDSLSKSIDKVLALNSLSGGIPYIGIVENPLIIGIYCKPNSDFLPRMLINRKYIGNYWLAMGILLHELGHLLNHHENLCSDAVLESYADMYLGRSMAMLKATKEQALMCLDLIDDNQFSLEQYPPKGERQKQILKGYNDHLLSINSELSFTSINPRIRWKKVDNGYQISVDEIKINIPLLKGWARFEGGAIDPNLGIFYLDSTKSTYQLFEYGKTDRGTGQLVNDRTPLTYLRTGPKNYRFYNKSRIIKIADVKDDIKEGNDKDYEIHYREAKNNAYSRIVLIDYFYVRTNILMPAFIK